MYIGSRYETTLQIGEGASSAVWRARDLLENSRAVALKILHQREGSAVERFRDECRLLNRLRHPGVVSLYECGFDRELGRAFAATECVDGSDFLAALSGASSARLFGALCQICSILDFLHRRGIAHGDLKPSHMLVSREGKIVLLDLGLAHAIRKGEGNAPSGTLPYTAPEILQGKPADGRSDLYALGVVLFQLLENRLPFDGSTPADVIRSHLSSSRPRLEKALGSGWAWLAPSIDRLLALDPACRPAQARELVLEWARALDLPPPGWTSEAIPSLAELPLTGRSSEMASIESWIEGFSEGNREAPEVVLVIEGEGGIGKTRLLREARAAARWHGVVTAESRGSEIAGAPFGIWAELLRQLRPAAEQSDVVCRSLYADCEETLSATHSHRPTDENEIGFRYARLLEEISRRVPVLLLIDDFHWADGPSRHLLEKLSRELEGQRVRIAISIGTDPGLAGLPDRMYKEGRTKRIGLVRLEPEDLGHLVQSVLCGEAAPEGFVAALHRASGGNPLFVHETLEAAALAEGPLLERREWALSFEKLVPPSVDGALSRRLRFLSTGSLDQARTLAALGESIPFDLAGASLGSSPEELRRLLDLLERSNIIVPQSETPGRVVFRHARLQQILYSQLDEARKREIHLAAARILFGMGQEAWAELISFHLLRAGDDSAIVRNCRIAAEKAKKLQAFGTAARYLREALRRVSPEDPDWAETVLELASCLVGGGYHDEALEALVPLEARSELLGRSLLSSLLARKATALMRRHPGTSEGLAEAERAVALATQEGDPEAAIAVMKEMAVAQARQGRYREALPHFQKALKLAEGASSHRVRSELLNNLGIVHIYLSELDQAESRLQEAQTLAFEIGDKPILASSFHNLSIVYQRQGRREALIEAAGCTARLEKSLGHHGNRGAALCSMGTGHKQSGQLDQALKSFEEARTALRKGGDRGREVFALDLQGDVFRTCGRFDDALRCHGEALALSESDQDFVQQAYACAALAQDHLERGDLAAARSAAERAVLISDGLASLRVRARAALTLADIDLAEGHDGRALATAERLLGLGDQSGTLGELEADIYLLLARAHAKRGETREASAAFTRALARVEALKLLEEKALALHARSLFEDSDELRAAARQTRRQAAEVIRHIASQIGDAALTRDYLAVGWRARLLERHEADSSVPGVAGASERRLEALYDIVASINSLLDPEPLLEKVMDIAVSIVGAERGLLILLDPDSGAFEVKVARGVDRETIVDATRYSRGIVREAGQGQSILAIDAEQDGRFQDFRSVSLFHIKSLMCAPLKLHDRIIGTVYLDSRLTGSGFSEQDLRFLEAFAHHAAIAIENARLHAELRTENDLLRKTTEDRYSFGNLLGRSRTMQQVFELLERAAESSLPVLIEGESGTGKELVARALHFNGSRRSGSFVSQNCTAIPEALLESELFGHVRGAFTGADRDRKGLFELAHRGSLFLDEIGDLPLSMQPKLLRVLEEGEFRPLGSRRALRVDVRVISATNRDLGQMLADGLFREDLYYRLNVLKVSMPPLRERREDIPVLVEHLLGQAAQERGAAKLVIDGKLLALFIRYDWPGNVRELENVLSRLAVTRRGSRITLRDLESDRELSRAFGLVDSPAPLDSLRDLERRQIHHALEKTAGNREQAAKLLGISRATIFRKIRDLHLG